MGNSSCPSPSGPGLVAAWVLSLPPSQLTLAATLLGLLLSDGLSLGQQNSLGNFIVAVGQSILTSAAQGQLLSDNS